MCQALCQKAHVALSHWSPLQRVLLVTAAQMERPRHREIKQLAHIAQPVRDKAGIRTQADWL